LNLFELFVKIGVKDEASGKLSDLSSKLGNGLKTAAKIGTAAVTTAAAGIAALTTQATNNFAEFEQLAGGAELMFGEAFHTVMNNASNAYKTVQMSQNEYLQQVNGFATGLKTALSGNEQAAADLAHRIIQAEADIVAATGNTQENVQNAFNGIMKSNFTMLDNLQIGITPTKEGFQEVIDKVNEWNKANGEATKYQMGNLADMQSALVDYIDMVGMSGYAQREASETITGSLSSMKAAWTNLVTGFADDSADLDKLIGNLTDSVVGYTDESGKKVKGVLDNLLPAIEKSLGGIAKLIEGAAPKIIEILPGLVDRVVPSLITAATDMVNAVVAVLPDLLNTVVDALIQNAPSLITAAIGLVQSLIQGIQDNYQILVDGAIQIVTQLATGILNMLPQVVQLGLDLIVSLANGIAASLPELIPTIIDVVLQIVDTLTNPETLSNLLDAALVLLTELAYGLMDAIPALVDATLTIVEKLVAFLIDPVNIGKLLLAAVEIIIALGVGIVNSIPRLIEYWKKVPRSIIDNFKQTDWGQLGKDLVAGFKNGISRSWSSLKKWFKNLFGDLIGVAKKILGIASPSKVFKKLGSWTADGFGIGFEDEFASVKDDMEDALNFEDASVGINASIRKVGAGAAGMAYGGTSIGNITINIDGAKYSNEQSLAEAVAEAIQSMTDRRAAVYA
jgi:phage-related protein